MTKLIEMEKDGEQIPVHPKNVAEHEALGWTVVAMPPAAPKTPAEKPAAEKPTAKSGKK